MSEKNIYKFLSKNEIEPGSNYHNLNRSITSPKHRMISDFYDPIQRKKNLTMEKATDPRKLYSDASYNFVEAAQKL